MALHSSSLTQLRWTIGSSGEVNEAPSAKVHGQFHSHLRGDDNFSMPKLKLPQLKRSRGAHRCVFTRRASAIRQAGGAVENVQATFEFLIDHRTLLTDMDSQIQQLIDDDDDELVLRGTVENVECVFRVILQVHSRNLQGM